MNHDAYPDYYLADILRSTKTIALVGASPNVERPSHRVMAFLLRKGYTVFPVNPGQAGKEAPNQGRTHPWFQHARGPCRRQARSHHRRARHADLPDDLLRLR
jgi:hypothetical protein